MTVGSGVPNLRAGDRVAGFTPNGSLSTVARAQHPFLFKLPGHTTFESAATLPLAYSTASYALVDQARMHEGETLLIHGAASAVGQAALAIGQMVGADLWTTIKSADEKTFLMHELSVPEDRILYSGSQNLTERIKDATEGCGVDVVFDTLTERRSGCATSELLAEFGRLINIGPQPNGTTFSMKANTKVISVDIIAISKGRPQILQRTLADVARMLKHGKLQPVQRISTYGISETVAALQEVQAAGQCGKVIVVPKDDEHVMVISS
jgi:NADPH:quinone reductase-like Zn-dependent oxidoreductase